MRDTIDMAREAGIDEWWDSGAEWRETFNEHLKTLVELARADEREACARVCEDFNFRFQDDSVGSLQDAAEAIRARRNT